MNIRDRIIARKQRAQAIVDEMDVLLDEIDAEADLVESVEPEPAPQPETTKPKRETPRPQAKARPQASGDTLELIVRDLAVHGSAGPTAIANRIGRNRGHVGRFLKDQKELFERHGSGVHIQYSLSAKGREFLASLSGSSPASG